jgi:hypothetical protein
VRRDTVLEVSATIAAAFLCFWVAEEIGHVSGVLAVVILSIFMAAIGKYAVSPDVTVRHCLIPNEQTHILGGQPYSEGHRRMGAGSLYSCPAPAAVNPAAV